MNRWTHFSYLQEVVTALFVKQQNLILSFSELGPFSFSVARQYNINVTYSFCLRLDVNACLLYVWCPLQLFKCIRDALENNAIWIPFYLLFLSFVRLELVQFEKLAVHRDSAVLLNCCSSEWLLFYAFALYDGIHSRHSTPPCSAIRCK